MKHSTRETRYGRLIRTRCADNSLNQYNFTNPADTPYNPKHLGSYARWACDLYADIVVIMADRRCLDQYLDLRGQPACCRELPDGSQKWVRPANGYLLQLLQSIGRDIGTPDNPKPAGVFLADAVPFLGISKAVMYRRKCVYRYCAERYILPLLDIINPKTVVSVGAGPSNALFHLLNPSPQCGMPDIDMNDPMARLCFSPFSIRSGQSSLFPVYHPSYLGQLKRGNGNAAEGYRLMLKDWARIMKWMLEGLWLNGE